jgi:hypothetical protein
MGIGGYIVLISAMLFLMVTPQLSADASKNMDVGITLSKTCITMIKNNITSNCPGYDVINALHEDSSNQEISGKFIFKDGIWQRDNSNFNQHYNFYVYSGPVLWIDPPGDIVGRIATITIETQIPEYKVIESKKLINGTLIVGHSRHVDDRCYRASITAEDWLLLLGDTLQYMQNDCNEDYTNFNHLKSKVFEKTYFDITTSYKWTLDNFIKDAKVNCSGLCFEY